MKTSRMNRLFSPAGYCLDVAIDHGMFGELSFLPGIENMRSAIEQVARAGPDAIQLPPGTARILQSLPLRPKPALVLRSDVANVYGRQLPSTLFSELIDDPVGQAVALDAACVVVNLFDLPGQPQIHRKCIQNINALQRACERAGMPLMIEPLVMQDNTSAGGYMVDGNIDKILPLVRQAVELGADIIKADPCSEVDEYHRVIEIAQGLPVLVRGGGRTTDLEILQRTEHLMQQGAKGIVYGRNIIQHPTPRAMTQALMAIVHTGANAAEAMQILAKGTDV